MFFNSHFDPKEKVWHGDYKHSTYHPNVSVGQVILQRLLSDNPNKVIQISDNNGMKITSSEMRSLAIRAANHYLKLGLQQEDVVGFLVYNSDNITPLVLGCLVNGHIVHPLDPAFSKVDIVHQYKKSRPKLIFCDSRCYETCKSAIDELRLNCPIYVVNKTVEGTGNIKDFFQVFENEFFYIPCSLKNGGEQTAFIMCTSGTTGLPKSVTLSHQILLKEGVGGLKYNDVLLCVSSMYWFTGVLTIISSGIKCFTRIITDRPFTPDLMIRLIRDYRVTAVIASPTQMAEMVYHSDFNTADFSSISIFSYVGGSVPQIILDMIESRLTNGHLFAVYGLTEVGGAGTIKLPFHPPQSVGKLECNTQMVIVDDNRKRLGVNEPGEIRIKLNFKNVKYVNDPDSDGIEVLADEDGWVPTGDIGYFDEVGNLFITDRKKNIIKCKGFSVSLSEIEMELKNIPEVVNACVCGVTENRFATEVLVAAVVKRKGSNLTAEKIFKHIKDNMASFKQITGGIHFFDTLPLTPSGKVMRKEVQTILTKLYNEERNSGNKL